MPCNRCCPLSLSPAQHIGALNKMGSAGERYVQQDVGIDEGFQRYFFFSAS